MSSTPKGERRHLDAYMTPQPLADALVGLLPINPECEVVEPHVGGGAFVRALRASGHRGRVIGVDIEAGRAGFNECDEQVATDFLDFRLRESEHPWWVIGNPPFAGLEKHVDHALTIAPNVAFLLRLAVMESGKRVPCWQRWPLRSVWVLAERPSFTGSGTDSAAYGWFWFDRHHSGPATVVPGWSWKS